MFRKIHTAFLSLAFLALSMSGCGGGASGDGAAGSAGGGGIFSSVFGVAASGAPIFGVVNLKDSSNPTQSRSKMTASDGSFSFDTTALTPPFILMTTVNGQNLYSLAPTNSSLANVTPLTNVITSIAAGGVDLDAFYLAANPSSLAVAVAGLVTAEADLQAALAPMLNQFGVSGNIISTSFNANHTGIDALLDSIDVTVDAIGTVTITKKGNAAAVIYNGSATNIGGGTFNAPNIPPVPTALPGLSLYMANCSGCHGDITTTTISGRQSVALINNAIATDLGSMSFLSGLTTPQIQNISNAILALSTPPVAPAGGVPAGDALYGAYCANCHEALGTSTKLGASFVRVQNAISADVGTMGTFSGLSVAYIQAIVLALNSAPPPPILNPLPPPVLDGTTLYNTNCSGCHGALDISTKRGMNLTRFNNAVVNNVGNMGYLSSLGVTEVQNIINALAVSPAPTPVTSGEALYTANCSGCHNPLATSTKGGATVQRIQGAINANTGAMGGLSLLTPAQLTDIESALAIIAPPPIVTPTGDALYAAHCSGCHNPLATSTKGGASVQRIQGAIDANTGAMGFLGVLTAAEVADIALALVSIAAPGPAPATGDALYAANCSGCHGALAASTKGGASEQRIQGAITANIGAMGVLNTLTAAQVADIAAALAPIAPPAPPVVPGPAPNGSALYATNCSGCHGSLDTSTKGGATIARIQTAIDGNIGTMGSLSQLTVLEVTDIAAVLAPIAPPAPPVPTPAPNGAALYAAHCAGCHGPLDSSAKGSTTVARIQAAIAGNIGSMGTLNVLTVAEITEIVAALAPIAPPAPPVVPPTGPELYAMSCSGCHGQLAASTKGGATAARINTAIANNVGSMGSLNTLTQAQITDIETALAAIAPPPPPVAQTPGETLYANNCAGCHAPLATSFKGGATEASIQGAITANVGTMGSLSFLTAAEITDIATVLAPIAPPAAPAPPACGTCHSVDLATLNTGRHRTHNSKIGFRNNPASCGVCHGAGYSTTANVAATHNNGNTELDTAFLNWIPAATAGGRSTCGPACHPGGAVERW